MAEAGEQIDHRQGQVALLAQFANTAAAVAFRQRRAVFTDDQRQMAVAGGRQPQDFEDEQLPRGIGQVVLAAQNVGDPHERVVDGVAEEERRTAVGAADDEIADVVAAEGLGAADQIVECDRASGRNPKAQGRFFPLAQALLHRFRGEPGAGAGIARGPAGGALAFARLGQGIRRAETGIGQAGLFQLGVVALVNG